LRRFFFASALSEKMIFEGEDAHHICNVLRLPVGSIIGVAGSDGISGEAKILSITPHSVLVQLRNLTPSTEPPVAVWLVQALTKGEKMDWIVEKAVELGVAGIIPIMSEHCVVRYDETKCERRRQRWQNIASSAAKQSGRGKVPPVFPICCFTDVFAKIPGEMATMMLYENEKSRGFRTVLNAHKDSWALFVGPEGGFSSAETEEFKKHGGCTVGMGPRILRTETAGLAAMTIVMYECGGLE